MELHPILEARCPTNPGLWYCISASGDVPSLRLGHTCTYIPGLDGAEGKVYAIGGANPDGAFPDVFILDLATFHWEQIENTGLKPRYEHSAFVPASKPHLIYIYGGANMSGNHNDVQVLDTTTNTCQTVSITSGMAPSARTFRGSAVIGDRFIVYSGGAAERDAVGDRQVHCFDAHSHAWSTLTVQGDPPKPRQGHVILSARDKIIVHGGLSGTTMYDDLHILDMKQNTWKKCKTKKGAPCARAGHSGCYHDGSVYIFGGMGKHGALDDLYQLNLETLNWRRISTDGPPPATRLTLAMCVCRVRAPQESSPPQGDAAQAGATGEGGADGAGVGGAGGESTQDILAAGQIAKEGIEEQLRLGSAGSVRSMGSSSAGSQRSEPNIISPQIDAMPQTTPLPCPEPIEITGPSKLVDLLLVHGGMDTEGEIFDDCLVYMLKEEPCPESAENGGASGGGEA